MGVQWFVESGLFKCLQHPGVLLLCAQMRILQDYQEVLPDCTTFHESEVLKQEGNLITTQKHGLPAVGSGNPSAEEADCSGLEVLQLTLTSASRLRFLSQMPSGSMLHRGIRVR